MSAERQRPGGDELEDEVRDPERGEERVELAGRPERRADDDEADPAEHPRDEEGDGDDQPGPGERAADGHRGRAAAAARGWASDRPYAEPACRRDMGVDLGRREALVAEQLLDDPQVGAAVEQVGREAVAEGVRRDAERQTGPGAQAIEPEAQAAHAERRAAMVQEDLGGRIGRSVDRRRRRRSPPEEHRPAIGEVGGRAPPAPAGRAGRSVPCGPCRRPGSRPAGDRAHRASRRPAR